MLRLACFAMMAPLVALVAVSCQQDRNPVGGQVGTPSLVAGKLNAMQSKSQLCELPVFPADPSGFIEDMTNPWLAFESGKTFHYISETDEGTESTKVEVTLDTKLILGVTTTVVHDQVFLEGELIEDTRDWYAEDRAGNVWYFGEFSQEIEDGEVVSTEGSWQAGIDGALPGIAMLATPCPTLEYRQEFAAGVAEDMASILNSSKRTITVPYGTFKGALTVLEWNPLEEGSREYKYYVRDVGMVSEFKFGNPPTLNELVAIEYTVASDN